MHNDTGSTDSTADSVPFPGRDTPRIYVASLSDYNAGVLHGRWVDATLGEAHISAEVAAMLRESRYPNVLVPCPDCLDFAADGNTNECSTCHGARVVASAEEWAVHDYEGFCSVRLSEWESFANIAALAEAIEEHGEAFARWFDYMNGDTDAFSVERFREAYRGHFDSLEDHVCAYLDDVGLFDNVNDTIKQYFDFAAYARDLETGGDVWTAEAVGGGVYVFDSYV